MINHRQLFLLHTAQTSPSPRLFEIVSAEGMYLYDTAGKRYMDLVSGFAVSNVGHRHPEVIEAIKAQLDKHLHVTVYGEFVQSPQVLFAKNLLDTLPEVLDNVYFVNSGAEATEGAMKVVKKYTGRTQILGVEKAYHGSTQGALSLIGSAAYRTPFQPLLPEVEFLRFNAVEDLEKITRSTAAVFLETIQGEAGIRLPDKSWIQAVRRRCTETGTLLVLDEIQTGFGRTGKLFAFEHFDIVPDILLLAKGLGGGMPIGAFIAPRSIMESIKDHPILGHITTFGGHPVSCVAGDAALQFMLRERLWEAVPEKEALLRKALQHPAIKEIRGKGMMLALQLESFEQVEATSRYCAAHGLMIDWFLHCETALRIAPPLIITEKEIMEACTIIKAGLDRL